MTTRRRQNKNRKNNAKSQTATSKRLDREERKIDALTRATRQASLGTFEKRMLPKATKDYLNALVDPYTTPSGVSSPDKISRKSFRTISWCKGTFKTGTNDIGFIAVDPNAMAFSDSKAVASSQSTYAGSIIQTDTTTTGVADASSNAPFETADISAKELAYRIVACGVRIMNTTPYLDRGGAVVGLFEPDNGDLAGLNKVNLQKYPEVHSLLPSDKWIHAEVCPVSPTQFEFDDTSPGTGTTLASAPLALIIAAPSGTPQTFEYEVVAHIEYVGQVVGMEPTHVDPIGQAAILQVAASLGGGASDKWITKMASIVRETAGVVADLTRTVNDVRALSAAVLM